MKNIFSWIATNRFLLMAVLLRGYSLFNCLEIQFALVGKLTGWIFTVIIEMATFFILMLIVRYRGMKFLFTFAFYAALSFGLVMLNDASLNFKLRQQAEPQEVELRQLFEKLRKEKISQLQNKINVRQSEIDENDNYLAMNVSMEKQKYFKNKTVIHSKYIDKFEAEKTKILAIDSRRVSSVRRIVSEWLPESQITADKLKIDIHSVHDNKPQDIALIDSWGMDGGEAKKLLFLVMSILIELLIFGFALMPKVSNKSVSKNIEVSQNDLDKNQTSETIKYQIPPEKKTIKKSQKSGRRKIETIDDLRRDMIDRFNSLGKYPAGNCYNKKWLKDYKRLRVELWPEKKWR